ncbi:MAG: hypothetical protein KBC95_00795 [Candidatus Peribacteraceae bacterium]|nr:hypothetical protein [Candidatus Peribacteraceae bacterium]
MKKVTLFRVREGKKDIWNQWCQSLETTLRQEAIHTLEEEQVRLELVIGLTIHGANYVVGYMDGECLPANMDQKINQQHQLMKKECLERMNDEATLLYALQPE